MIVFGCLTIRNIKLSRQRVHAPTTVHQIRGHQQHVKTHLKSREYEMLLMILVQLAVYLITCLPYPTYLAYSTVTLTWKKSTFQMALDRFFANIALALTNVNFSATFYIYVLTTRVFRKDLKRIIVDGRLFKICFHAQRTQMDTRTNNCTIGTVAVVMNQQNSARVQWKKH